MTKQQQYNEYLAWGGTMTIEEWENDARYDKSIDPTRTTINNLPLDDDLKATISNMIADKLESAGYNISENFREWFKNELSEDIINNVLESIVQWEQKAMN